MSFSRSFLQVIRRRIVQGMVSALLLLTPGAGVCRGQIACDDNIDSRLSGANWYLGDPTTTGDRSVTFCYDGARFMPLVPAVGMHPRLLFTGDDLLDIQDRLQTTRVGQAMFQHIQIMTGLLRQGRSWYNALPAALKNMPDGSPRIGNVGYDDQYPVYNDLIQGSTYELRNNTNAHIDSLLGMMALEAFECLVSIGQPGIWERAQNLRAALDTWAGLYLADPSVRNATPPLLNLAICYDLNYWAMTDSQLANVRTALVHQVSKVYYPGVGVPPEAVVGNWVTLDSNQLLALCAVEGEARLDRDGSSWEALDDSFFNGMRSYYKFLTYGWYPSGAPYEGMGKNELSGVAMVAFARRGYDYFGHPHVRKFMNEYRPAILAPFGYGLTQYDVFPSPSQNDTYGYVLYNISDYIGLKWAYPDNPAADFLWRNCVNTRYQSAGTWKTFLDPRRFTFRSFAFQDLLAAAAFALDPSSDDWTSQAQAAIGTLDYIDPHGGTGVARSGYAPESTALQFHVRQDFGGHTAADRNTFILNALGRLWVKDQAFAQNHAGKFHNIIQVDGQDMYLTPQDGVKMIIPAKLAGWKSASNACFLTGDATYAYSWQYKWRTYLDGDSQQIDSGYQKESNTFNSFRRTNNLIPENYGNTPLCAFPYWNNGGKPGRTILQGIEKKPYNPMRQVYRTLGLVRGVRPYALVIDDAQKDSARHTYTWLAQMPTDLSIFTGSDLDAGLNPATDIEMKEPATTGNRRLLVRILRADGTPAQAAGTKGSPLGYLLTDTGRNRLVIERRNVVVPNYRVLLYPYTDGDPLPVTTLQGNTLTVQIGSQKDTFTFVPRTATVGGQSVTMSEFTLSRNGSQLLDYRNQIEPAAVR